MLNDRGRAALAERLGPAVEKIEGEVVSQDDGTYTMSVYRIRQMNGNSALWTGEQVRVQREFTIGHQVRKLNRTRTAVLAGSILVATVVLFFGKALGIGGGADQPTVPGDPEPSRR